MAVKTFFVKNVAVNGFGSLSETNPGATTTATGWVVAKTSNLNFSKLLYGTERSGAFSTTDALATAAVPSGGDSWRSENIIDGVFANTNWTLTFAVRAVSSASSQTGRVKVRLWRGTNAAGTGATQITSGMLTGTTTAALSTTVDATSVVTFTPGATVTLNGEYLFVQCEWEIVVASGANQGDVDFRAGASTVVTPDFTAATDAFTGNDIAVAAPVFGAPTLVQIVALPSAANFEVSSPSFDTANYQGISNFVATVLEVAPPVEDAGDFSPISLGGDQLSAAPFEVASPVIDPADITQVHVLSPALLSVAPPVLGAVKVTYNFAANNIAVSPPVLQSTAITYNAVGANLTPASPVIGAGTFGQTHNLATGAFAVGSPVLGVGISSGSIVLTAVNIAVASPVLGGGALSQKQVLSAAALAVSSPVLGAGFPIGPPLAQLILSPYALDNGLNAFFAADQILMCSMVPTDYANALTVKLGGKTFGPGGTFTTPQAGSPAGRKVTSTAIADGGISVGGTAACWTAIDTVNSQWLATGIFTGSGVVTSGQGFSLDSFAIHLNG